MAMTHDMTHASDVVDAVPVETDEGGEPPSVRSPTGDRRD
jgi:hypothetical protein